VGQFHFPSGHQVDPPTHKCFLRARSWHFPTNVTHIGPVEASIEITDDLSDLTRSLQGWGLMNFHCAQLSHLPIRRHTETYH
jgi:hypothetical protein